MTLYELNQANYANLPEYTDDDFRAAQIRLEKYFKVTPSRYFMLLNRESSYYTLFHITPYSEAHQIAAEVIDVAKDLGPVRAIEDGEGAMEIWVDFEDECRVFYLFDYERGVIEV